MTRAYCRLILLLMLFGGGCKPVPIADSPGSQVPRNGAGPEPATLAEVNRDAGDGGLDAGPPPDGGALDGGGPERVGLLGGQAFPQPNVR
ncbi:MAG TPA: hypothetical protein VGP93_07530 [Polyangiaceae bacterium]|jgi:hypothetical protein|nr:hypothetical protein [Polyangiaceae bacterium]